MADEDRPAPPVLTPGSSESDFFELVRRIERLRPEAPPVGESVRPRDEHFRFVQEPSLAFPSSTIRSVTPGENGEPLRVAVEFMGLLGPSGPLPLHITAYARDRVRNHDDRTLARFLDIFHHRLVSLFFRAWASAQQCVQFERKGRDRFAAYVASLCGRGMPSMADRDDLPDRAKLHFSGLLAGFSKHPSGLEQFCESYFRVGARVEEFVGHWQEIPPDNLLRLGESPQSGTLGASCILGARLWDCQQNFRLTLGPMDLPDYERLLPGGNSFDRLVAWVRNYIGLELGCQVRLILRRELVPQAIVGGYGRLGWTTWLGDRPRDRDADELIIQAT